MNILTEIYAPRPSDSRGAGHAHPPTKVSHFHPFFLFWIKSWSSQAVFCFWCREKLPTLPLIGFFLSHTSDNLTSPDSKGNMLANYITKTLLRKVVSIPAPGSRNILLQGTDLDTEKSEIKLLKCWKSVCASPHTHTPTHTLSLQLQGVWKWHLCILKWLGKC